MADEVPERYVEGDVVGVLVVALCLGRLWRVVKVHLLQVSVPD